MCRNELLIIIILFQEIVRAVVSGASRSEDHLRGRLQGRPVAHDAHVGAEPSEG